MGRLPRVYIEGIIYYVTSRSGHNQKLFADASDYSEYISLINKYKQQYGFKLFAYVLLPTHLHLAIELKHNVPISNIMHDINSLYTKIFNGRYNKRGHLFQERFKTVLVEKETCLLPLLRHIYLNPARLKLADQPQNYPYSNYTQFLEPAKRHTPDVREEVEEVFALLRGREGAFVDYVANADQERLSEFRKRLHKRRVLGSKNFAAQIKSIIEEEAAKEKRKKTVSKKTRIAYMSAVSAMALITVVTIRHFYSKSYALKSEYDKTLALYQRTLEVLREERDRARAGGKEDVGTYQWKINLAEKALEKLKAERAMFLQLEGYAWQIQFTPLGGQKGAFVENDVISFKDSRIKSDHLSQRGFGSSRYSLSRSDGGKITWETIQSNPAGETASWHGEWDGRKMKGILSLRSGKGKPADFAFVSTGAAMRR
jgi:REP element-mobilizing transposase RayT